MPLIDNMREFGGVITEEDEGYPRHDIIEEAKGFNLSGQLCF